MKGNMIFGIYGHNETSISSCMVVPFNDIQPIWNKICIVYICKNEYFSPRVPRSHLAQM